MELNDRIRIVNYGHLVWCKDKDMFRDFKFLHEEDGMCYYDMRPELVGKEGTIVDEHNNRYSIKLDDGNTMSWFSDNQLEKIE